MLKQTIIALLILFAITPQAFSQIRESGDAYAKEWKTVDSLMDADLPKSALEIASRVLKDATVKGNLPSKMKAQILIPKIKYGTEEDSQKKQIEALEAYIQHSSGVELAIWQSLTAELYWSYYEENRYQLYSRTKLEATTSNDIDTWDVDALMHHIAGLYEASLSQKALLQSTPVETYKAIVVEGENTQGLRPTLYDLIAFKAIDFFKDGEANVIKAGDAFQIDGSLWYETADKFSSVKVKVKDAGSFKFKALRLFQDVLAFHLNDTRKDALIDADLQRLSFVHDNGVHPQNDSLYVSSLKVLANHYADNPAAAQALYLIAYQQMDKPESGRMMRGMPVRKGNSTSNLPEIKKQLEAIVSKFPKSEGALNAQALLGQITQKTLDLKTESVNIPIENIKALVNYRNIGSIYLALYKIPLSLNGQRNYEQDDTLLARFRKLTPLRTWRQNLPGTEDFQEHSTEIKIDGLPAGNYALIASTKMIADSIGQIAVYSNFQVSKISFIADQNKPKEAYVLDRKTGYPLSNVKAIFFGGRYDNSRSNYFKLGQSSSDEKGIVAIPENSQNDYNKTVRATLFIDGKDSLYISGYLDNYSRNNDIAEEENMHTFFFTDRSIYRPGQILYFKGITVKSAQKNKKNETVANAETTVELYDANNQKKATLKLRSNEFGSFSGSFQLPEGLMNGSMRIQNEHGSIGFSVEEYKRPKFYVEFDTLKDSYALNEAVKVKGFAKAYAGNNIDGAAVKYRVVRQTRFPYYWCYYYWGMPQSSEVEIASGTITTKEDGSFLIPFETLPDLSVEPKAMPSFYYQVYADVTDVNGETRTGSQSLMSGYTTLQIIADVPEHAAPKDLKELAVTTENLNGVFSSANVHVSIARLKFPGFKRQRLWEVPDQFAMTESEFHAAFPEDEYKEESNHLNWETEKVLFEKTWTTIKNEPLKIPDATWYQNGWYVIEIKTKDNKGHEITEKKYTHVWAPGKKEANQEAMIVYAGKDSYQPGDKLELWLATGVDQPYLLHHSSVAYNVRNPIYLDVQEKDRGGLTFSWLYVSNNRTYTIDKTIAVPWSNKELQLEWGTHRDKLQPAEKEKWTLTIKGDKKEKVAAELLAGMYDASLDAFQPHQWEIPSLFPSVYAYSNWNRNWGFGIANARQFLYLQDHGYFVFEKSYSTLSFGNIEAYDPYQNDSIAVQDPESGAIVYKVVRREFEKQKSRIGNASYVIRKGSTPGISDRNVYGFMAPVVAANKEARSDALAATRHMILPDPTSTENASGNNPVQIRKNLQETAFFFPELRTDSLGNVSFAFTMPEALTEWKFMAFAHTKDWKLGYLQGKVKTQKDLMVMPNMPRFLRQGDNIQISTKVVNLSAAALAGNATLELLDAQTLQPIALSQFMQLNWSGKEGDAKSFNIEKGQSSVVSWNLHVPESRYTPVIVRIVAKSGAFSDGEENTLPVLTNRVLVTETMPITVKGSETKSFSFNKLLNNNSSTLLNHGLTLEFTGNPAWYAVQALPYLMEYPYECAEQTFNRFYANALAGNIVAQSPKVQQIFEQWQQKDASALLSNLQKNEDLKVALLEETPWVMEAQNETEQKHRVGLLFQANKLSKELDKTFGKLAEMQMQDGGFPWFKGMGGDRFITQYILTGIGRLQNLGLKNMEQGKVQELYTKALVYVDRDLRKEYETLLKNKADMKLQQISDHQVQYLYMRSFYSTKSLTPEDKKAYDYYMKQAVTYWAKFNPYLKGQLALALNRVGNIKAAQQIMASLKETAIVNESLGMYWKDMPRGYRWSEAPIESQSLLIEAFSEIAKDNKSVDAMKYWLLKQKQTQNWNTTKATADACYALLLTGNNWLSNEPKVSITTGKVVIESDKVKTEAGTGYFQKRIAGKEVVNEMGNIKVSVQQSAADGQNPTSWGAVYWQYFEDMDKVTSSVAPIDLKKQLFIEKISANGPVLTVIQEGNELHVGDKVKVRIELKVDRDMEYVQLKDMRAACFEPIDVLSQYKYQSGTGYFQSTKDLATHFFFDHLSKGTYVFEYAVWVNAKGNFSNGISSIQCMYAPEFSSHSEGIRVEVK